MHDALFLGRKEIRKLKELGFFSKIIKDIAVSLNFQYFNSHSDLNILCLDIRYIASAVLAFFMLTAMKYQLIF